MMSDDEQRIERLERLHKPYRGEDTDENGSTIFFEACEIDDEQDWPCDTAVLLDRLAASLAREAASSADISTLVAAIESALEDFDRRDELSAIDTLKTALTRRQSVVKL